MIFTYLRKFENEQAATRIVCTDEDFNTALGLAEIYPHHRIFMFNSLPKHSETTPLKNATVNAIFLRRFRQCLPARNRQIVQLLPRTVDDILHNATGKALEKLKARHYRKP